MKRHFKRVKGPETFKLDKNALKGDRENNGVLLKVVEAVQKDDKEVLKNDE